MLPRQGGAGKQENDFYTAFLLPVPEDCWPSQASVAQRAYGKVFQVWKALPTVVSPCAVLPSESLAQGTQELQGRLVP